MTTTLKVPSIACDGCAKTITEAIQSNIPSADVSVDVANKIVTIETQASEEELKKVITETGHTVE
ncbi:MAG: heavy-metal-associated domain-containing protein [Microcystaceae cyanobacterium]